MPQTKQAKKALRKDIKRTHHNKIVKNTIRTLVKKTRKAIDAKSADAQKLIKKTTKALDKAVQKGQLKKNTASRTKSRLMRSFNKIKKTEK